MIIPISINFDDNYITPAKVTVYSIRKSTPIEVELLFFVLCDKNLSEKTRRNFSNFINKLENVKIQYCDIDQSKYKGAKGNAHIAVTAYYRLSSVSFIPYKKCLYIDCDTIVNTNICDLYKTDIGDNYLGAVRDIIFVLRPNTALKHMKESKLLSMHDYINSGVMVMNLEKMRENDVFSLFEKEISNCNPYLDQDVINRVCHGKIKLLDWTYNRISYFKEDIYKTILGESKRQGSGQIIHYAMGTKPWQNSKFRYASLWWKVAKEVLSEKEYDNIRDASVIESNLGTTKWIADRCREEIKIIIFGFSDIGMGVYCNLCNYGISADRIIFCDNNEEKRKEKTFFYQVISPELAYSYYPTAIWLNVVQEKRQEIVDQLIDLGIKEDRIINYYNKGIDYYKYLEEDQIKEAINEVTHFG